MNRHDRRKQRALERKARRSGDTMGASHQLGGIPERVLNHPAFKAGEQAAKEGRGLPQAYYDEIERAAELIVQWHAEQIDPDLRWLKPDADKTFISATLGDGMTYLADSPDAFSLLRWLDEKTGRRLSLNQAMWALRRCRAMPMRDGSFLGAETLRESDARKALRGALEQITAAERSAETDRVPSHPCPHCGAKLDGATSGDGAKPEPGDVTVCIYCGGINCFTDGLGVERMTDDALAELPEDTRQMLGEMQATIRSLAAARLAGGKKSPAEA